MASAGSADSRKDVSHSRNHSRQNAARGCARHRSREFAPPKHIRRHGRRWNTKRALVWRRRANSQCSSGIFPIRANAALRAHASRLRRARCPRTHSNRAENRTRRVCRFGCASRAADTKAARRCRARRARFQGSSCRNTHQDYNSI